MKPNLIIGALVVGLLTLVIGLPRLLRGELSTAMIGVMVVAALISLHGVETLLDAHLRRRGAARDLREIRRLIDMAGITGATPRQARRAYQRISTRARLQPVLLDQPDLESAAREPGPQQLYLLRLILVHLGDHPDPWRSVLTDGERLLEEADLPRRENGFLRAWQEASNTRR